MNESPKKNGCAHFILNITVMYVTEQTLFVPCDALCSKLQISKV